jgi:Family of unknown function (DUF5946)
VTSACPGCGADLLALEDGATHEYVGASSACWTRFAEVNVSLPPAPLRRLVTDAYMVQHPGVPERRAIQSVCLHLVALCLVLEHGLPADQLSAMLQRILVRPPAWCWLDPPVPNGTLTIHDVAGAADIDSYVRDVWQAWAPHRAQVEAWVVAAR